jgi:hypothetical protein
MAPDRRAKLEALGWWVWSTAAPMRSEWSARYEELVAFYEAHGKLPSMREPGKLGKWISHQRTARTTMAPERREKLEELSWWVWRSR